MAQYVYTMQGVTKVVPPQRTILQNINLSFFPGAKIGVLDLPEPVRPITPILTPIFSPALQSALWA